MYKFFYSPIQTLVLVGLLFSIVMAQDAPTIKLLPPQLNSGKLLMQALSERQSIRKYSEKALPLQTLSSLLWAANGINRPESGKRTAPSAMNQQEIDVYVIMTDGIYLYDAKNHSLHLIVMGDLRNICGKQEFVVKAPVNLVFVADYGKMTRLDDETKKFFAATDAGYVSQNVYLFCASEGLACVVRGGLDRDGLAKAMQLRPEQKIVLAHTVGYPAE